MQHEQQAEATPRGLAEFAQQGKEQEALVEENPEQFFRPPYVGHLGWIGVRLDRKPDWTVVSGLVADAQPKRWYAASWDVRCGLEPMKARWAVATVCGAVVVPPVQFPPEMSHPTW